MNIVSTSSINWPPDADADADDSPQGDLPLGAQTAQDAAQFKEWLRADSFTAQDRSVPVSEGQGKPMGEWLREVGDGLRRRESDYFNTLTRAARTGDPVDGLAVQQRLSELYLDHGLAVKVISKTAQAADALTRLQ